MILSDDFKLRGYVNDNVIEQVNAATKTAKEHNIDLTNVVFYFLEKCSVYRKHVMFREIMMCNLKMMNYSFDSLSEMNNFSGYILFVNGDGNFFEYDGKYHVKMITIENDILSVTERRFINLGLFD